MNKDWWAGLAQPYGLFWPNHMGRIGPYGFRVPAPRVTIHLDASRLAFRCLGIITRQLSLRPIWRLPRCSKLR